MSAHDEAVKAARQRYIDTAGRTDAAISAYLAHMAAAGWKLTPSEATEGMTIDLDWFADNWWSAMWDRAPSPEEAP